VKKIIWVEKAQNKARKRQKRSMEPSPPLGIKEREGLGSSRSSADPIFDDEYLFKMNGDPHFLFFHLEELLNINILLVFQKIVIYFSCRKTAFSA